MWIVIIGVVVVCCIIAGLAKESEENVANETAKQVAAKRPDAFIRLFSEEFPEFSDAMTFSKAEEMIKSWETTAASWDFKQHIKFFNQNEFKNHNAEQRAMTVILRNVSKEVSPDFVRHVEQNIETSYQAMRRAINSSLTLAV